MSDRTLIWMCCTPKCSDNLNPLPNPPHPPDTSRSLLRGSTNPAENFCFRTKGAFGLEGVCGTLLWALFSQTLHFHLSVFAAGGWLVYLLLFLTVKGVSLDEDFFCLIKPVEGERFIIPGKGSHKNKRSVKRVIIYLTNISSRWQQQLSFFFNSYWVMIDIWHCVNLRCAPEVMCGTVRAFIQLFVHQELRPDWCTLALWILEDKRLHPLPDLRLPDDDCYKVRTPEFWSLSISYTAHILYSRTVLRNAICSIPGGKFLILSDGGCQGELVSILVET